MVVVRIRLQFLTNCLDSLAFKFYSSLVRDPRGSARFDPWARKTRVESSRKSKAQGVEGKRVKSLLESKAPRVESLLESRAPRVESSSELKDPRAESS